MGSRGRRLSIRDTGTGIPSESLPHLFERFYRVEGPQGRAFEGSGIGLALVDQLVKLHGGRIEVESTLGSGSTFTVVLRKGAEHLPPAQIGTPQPSARSRAALPFVEEAKGWLPAAAGPSKTTTRASSSGPVRPVSRRRRRVLLVDDNADMRTYLCNLLSHDYVVESVAEGESALAAAKKRTPDGILTDVMLPGMDGFELLRRLRAESQFARVPVLMLSGRAGEDSRDEGVAAGADDYVVKPFDSQDLLRRVAAVLAAERRSVAPS